MIKNWKSFNESQDSLNKTKLSITDEDMRLFTDEPVLQKLVMDKKVTLMEGEVSFNSDDTETLAILDQYLEIPGKNV